MYKMYNYLSCAERTGKTEERSLLPFFDFCNNY